MVLWLNIRKLYVMKIWSYNPSKYSFQSFGCSFLNSITLKLSYLMYSAIIYVHLCHPSLLHQTGLLPIYINFENTYKGPEATDAKTDKISKYNPPSSHVSEKRSPQLQMNIQVMLWGSILFTEQVTAPVLKIKRSFPVLDLNFHICNKYQVHEQLSLGMKATHMHYGIQYTIEKHGNSQLKVQELIPPVTQKDYFCCRNRNISKCLWLMAGKPKY